MTIRNIALVLVLMLVVGLAACGGTPQEAEATVSPFVQALPADRAEMQIAAPGGVLPCGLAEVDWGIASSAFPTSLPVKLTPLHWRSTALTVRRTGHRQTFWMSKSTPTPKP